MTAIKLAVMVARDHAAAELAYQLRGGPVFSALSLMDLGMKPIVAPGMSSEMPIPNRSSTAAFVDLGLIIEYPEIWASMIDLGCPIILDVHFPFGVERQILAVQPGTNEKTRDRRKDAEMQDRWMDSGRMALARAMMAEATIVCSPREEWARLVDGFSDEVWVVPDVISPQTGYDFTESLLLVLERAYEIKLSRRSLNWFQRFVIWLAKSSGASGRARRETAARVQTYLEHSNIDWKARADGKQ
jgi:hypothetical protein